MAYRTKTGVFVQKDSPLRNGLESTESPKEGEKVLSGASVRSGGVLACLGGLSGGEGGPAPF